MSSMVYTDPLNCPLLAGSHKQQTPVNTIVLYFGLWV